MLSSVKAVVAIDVGTSSARAGLVDEQLNVHHIASRAYGLETPQPGYAEQSAEKIFAAVLEVIQACVAAAPAGVKIAGLALDTAMHSFLALDAAGRPLTPVWTWADMRAARTANRLAEDGAAARALYRRTGCPVHAMYFPAKALWLKEHDPETFDRAHTFTSIKGYLLMRLTGRLVDDLAIASGYGLLDLERLAWDPGALAVAGLTPERLPQLVEPAAIAGELNAQLASRLGLEPLPVVAGGSDGPFANVGAGCVQEGDMTITVGTSSAVRMFSGAPRVDGAMRTWCYYLGERTWVVGGAINGGASSLAWLQEAFGIAAGSGDAVHRELDRLAASVPPGAEGLIFAPYLAGERNPGLRGEARGYMAGIGLHHKARHFVRATMEGIAFQIAWVYTSVAEVAGEPEKVRITGGFVGSSVWPQILADVLGRPLEVPAEKEGSLVGTALFGLAALVPGFDWRERAGAIRVERTLQPDRASHERYRRFFEVYRDLYSAVQSQFSKILSLQEL